MSIDMTARHYPNALAVDPYNCGCTECLIGEYIPQQDWFYYAQAGDVFALAVDNIRNNTYDSLTELLNPYRYDNQDAKDACEALANLNR